MFSSTMFPKGNSLSARVAALSPLSRWRPFWRLWRNPGRFGISESCGRIHPPQDVFGPKTAFSLSLSPKAVDDHNPSTVRENKEIAALFEGRLSGSKT